MKMVKLLSAATLALVLVLFSGDIIAPQLGMFSVPALSTAHSWFGQMSPAEVGQMPILFAPSNAQLLHGGGIGSHFTPVLETSSWVPSMKTSGVNQMFALMSRGIGSKSKSK